MTNELEKQFFDTFGIEAKYEDGTCDMDDECGYTDCNTCQRINKFNYPQITDGILLQLICIYLDYRVLATQISIKHLKQNVLQGLIELHEQYNHKIGYYEEVRTLFKEG